MRIERVIADAWRREGNPLARVKQVPSARRPMDGCIPDGFLVGLLVGKGWLVRHGGGEGGVLAHGVVHAKAGAHHSLFIFGTRQASPRAAAKALCHG